MAKKWLENYNDSKVSTGPGFVGQGYDTTGRNYSPAWGGQFAGGGELGDPILTSNPNDPRLKAYTDSLNLYKAYRMQDKLMGPGSEASKTKLPSYEWSTKQLKDKRIKRKVQGIDEPISDDYRSEKDQFKRGYNPWSARKEDKQLLDYYKSLGFTSNDIMYHSSPDLVSDKIRPTGSYFDGSAQSPVYKKPKQPVKYQKPEPAPVVAQQSIVTPASQPKSLYEYEGEQVMAQTPYGGGSAMVGVKKKDGSIEYIRPEDYQRMGVPSYGQEYIKTHQKMAMGGVPGLTGAMYARIGAPSNGKYAKKTKASAKNGKQIPTAEFGDYFQSSGQASIGKGIGSGIGNILLPGIGGKIGGMIGTVAGNLLGGADDANKLARVNTQNQKNLEQTAYAQGAQAIQSQYSNIMQNGGEMQYYQNGLDWKPKSISKNGGWLNKYK